MYVGPDKQSWMASQVWNLPKRTLHGSVKPTLIKRKAIRSRADRTAGSRLREEIAELWPKQLGWKGLSYYRLMSSYTEENHEQRISIHDGAFGFGGHRGLSEQRQTSGNVGRRREGVDCPEWGNWRRRRRSGTV